METRRRLNHTVHGIETVLQTAPVSVIVVALATAHVPSADNLVFISATSNARVVLPVSGSLSIESPLHKILLRATSYVFVAVSSAGVNVRTVSVEGQGSFDDE